MFELSKKHIEESAVAIVRDFFSINGICNQLADNDKTPNIDGFITINTKNYHVQIKGSSKDLSTHSIDRKYFNHCIKNFLIYIFVSNIDNGIYSENYQIHYKIINIDDITLGLKNETKLSVNKLDFSILSSTSLTQFKENINYEFTKFLDRELNGITAEELLSIADNIKEAVTFNFGIQFDENLMDIKALSFNKAILNQGNNKAEVKMKQDNLTDLHLFAIESQQIKIPNTNIIINSKYNKLTNVTIHNYKNLSFVLNFTSDNYTIKVEKDLWINPYNVELLSDYITIIKYFTKYEIIKNEKLFTDLCTFKEESIKLRQYLIKNNLYKNKYDQYDIIKFFYAIYSQKINFADSSDSFRVHEVGSYLFILYEKDNKIKILSDIPFCVASFADNTKLTGQILTFAIHVDLAFRKCFTFDYIKAIVTDKENLQSVYPDEEIGMIIFNYLLIYWEYNSTILMLDKLYDVIKIRPINRSCDILTINYIQLKKILDIALTIEDLSLLSTGTTNTKNILYALCCSILLDRKIETKKMYENLGKEQLMEFNSWPIKYLYDRLCATPQ